MGHTAIETIGGYRYVYDTFDKYLESHTSQSDEDQSNCRSKDEDGLGGRKDAYASVADEHASGKLRALDRDSRVLRSPLSQEVINRGQKPDTQLRSHRAHPNRHHLQ